MLLLVWSCIVWYGHNVLTYKAYPFSWKIYLFLNPVKGVFTEIFRPLTRRQRRAVAEFKLPTEVQKYAFYFISQINNPIKEWNKFYLTRPIFCKTMLTIVNYIHTFNFVLIESHQLISFSINFPYILCDAYHPSLTWVTTISILKE